MTSEQDRLRRMMEEMQRGTNTGRKLFGPGDYNRETKSFEPQSRTHDPDKIIRVTPEDFTFGGEASNGEGMIVIAAEIIEGMNPSETIQATFGGHPLENVFVLLKTDHDSNGFPGTVMTTSVQTDMGPESFGRPHDLVRVIIRVPEPVKSSQRGKTILGAAGYVRNGGKWRELPLEFVPVKDQIFSRFGGLLETDALAEKKVLAVGLGSFGSSICVKLAESGIMLFGLMDRDRLEIANVVRHYCGLSDLGRLKTLAVGQAIKNKNPYAVTNSWPIKADWETAEKVRNIIRRTDLVIVTTDDQKSRRLINRLCVEEGKTCIFSGANRRAYGGQVLRVRPGESLCYQCFLMHMPHQAQDQEISNRSQAEGMAYTDRPVAIEPGLSMDIAPMVHLVVKLAIQELLLDKATTLRSLDEDLTAPYYFWLNRREPGTQYEDLEPLEFNLDGMHILRWYGVDIGPHPACPVCGDPNAFSEYLSASSADSKAALASVQELSGSE